MFDFTWWKESVFLVLIFIAIEYVFLMCPGCATPLPSIDIQTWAGDSKTGSIVRSQEEMQLKCSDPLFNEMVCITYEDMKKIYLTLPKCRSWDK
jgi:hypothetical protein